MRFTASSYLRATENNKIASPRQLASFLALHENSHCETAMKPPSPEV